MACQFKVDSIPCWQIRKIALSVFVLRDTGISSEPENYELKTVQGVLMLNTLSFTQA
jgi:hypothetical protein